MKANKYTANSSLAIRQEIQRFESVHPSIYAIYELIELIPDKLLQQQIRDNVICIESSFVNSQEWTLPRNVKELKIGLLGSEKSGKAALVYRYLTGSYTQEESPEGGRYKKEILINGESYLLLLRDEAGQPDQQFADWIDAIMFVFSVENENSFSIVYNFFIKLSNFRPLLDIPIILIGTQDYISSASPRLIDDMKARKLANDLHRCSYYETCATYGFCVDQVFQDACEQILEYGKRRAFSHQPPNGLIPPNNVPIRYPRPSEPSYNHNHFTTGSRENSTGTINDNRTDDGVPNLRSTSTQSHPSHDATLWDRKASERDKQSNVPEFKPARNPNYHPDPNYRQLGQGSSQPAAAARNGVSSGRPVVVLGGNEKAVADMFEARLPQQPHHNRDYNVHKEDNPSFMPFHNHHYKKDDNKKTKGSFVPVSSEIGVGRVIPVKQGWLYKKSSKSLNKEWKKKYVVLNNNGTLVYHPNLQDYMANENGKEISLLHTTVKVPGQQHQKLFTSSSNASSTSHPVTTANAIKGTPSSSYHQPSSSFDEQGTTAFFDERNLPTDMIDKMSLGPNSSVSQSFIKRFNSNLYHLSSASSSHNNNNNISINNSRSGSKAVPNNSVPQHLSNSANPNSVGTDGVCLKSFNQKPESPTIADVSEDQHRGGGNFLSTANNFLANASMISDTKDATSQQHISSKGTPLLKKKHRRMKSGGVDSEGYDFIVLSMDNKQWHFDAGSTLEKQSWVSAIESQILNSIQSHNSDNVTRFTLDPASLTAIKNVKGNAFCVDCETPGPEWASLNLGALMCIECSGIHRNLGTHISRVRSLQLDDWPPEYVKVMKALGNSICNSFYERILKGRCKPSPTTKREDKEKWIRTKYEQKEFLPPLLFPSPMYSEHLIKAVSLQELPTVFLILAHCSNHAMEVNKGLSNGKTALHISCSLGNVVITQLLLWNEANPYIQDKDGYLPLDYARKSGSQECVSMLTKHHVNSSPHVLTNTNRHDNDGLLNNPRGMHNSPSASIHHSMTTGSSTSSLISFWKNNSVANTR